VTAPDINIGTVGIGVVPSIRDFGPQVKTELTPQATKVGDDLGKTIGDRIKSQITSGIRDGMGNGSAPAKTQGGKSGEDYGGEFARVLKAKLSAAFRDLPKADIGINSSAADLELDKLRSKIESLAGKRVGVDISASAAAAEVDRIKKSLDELGARSPDIRVKVDTAVASAHLDEFRAKVDELSTKSVLTRVSAALPNISGDFSWMTAAVALLPLIVPLLGAVAGALMGVAVAGAAATAGLGVLFLAVHGVFSAVQALTSAQSKSAAQSAQNQASALASANGLLNAQDALKAAVQGVADAQRSADQSIVSSLEQVHKAEESYTAALLNEQKAQLALTAARVTAQQTIEDLNNQVKDGALQARQAALDLQDAQQNLLVVNFNSHSTAEQRAQAQLAVDQAQQHASEIALANQRTAASAAQANAQGVEGSQTVIDANQGVSDAVQNVADAHQGVVDAQAAAVQAQLAGAESVAKANQAVVQAQRALADAYASAGAQGVAAASSVTQAMSKLTPAGQKFALFIADTLLPALRPLFNAAQTSFLPALQKAITLLLPYLPQFADFIGKIGKVLGDLAVQAAQALTGPFWQQFFTFLSSFIGPQLQVFGDIIGNVVTGFAGLFQASSGTGASFGQWLLHLSESFAHFGTTAGSNSGFQAFLKFIRDNAPKVGDLLKELVIVAAKIIIVMAPIAVVILKAIDAVVTWLAKLSPTQMAWIAAGIGLIGAALLLAFGGPVTIVVAAIAAIAAGLTYLWTHCQTFRDIVTDAWHVAFSSFSWVYQNVVKPVFDSLGADLQAVEDAFTSVKDHVSQVWSDLGSAISDVWDGVKSALVTGINFITQNVLNPFIGAINDVLGLLPGNLHIPKIAAIVVTQKSTFNDINPQVTSHALGGVIPGYAPGVDSHLALLSPGEGILVPEATRALGGAAGINAINSTFSSRLPSSGGRFAGGGVVGFLEGLGSDVVSGIRHGLAASVETAMKAAEKPALAAVKLIPGGGSLLSRLGQGTLDAVDQKVYDFIAGKSSAAARTAGSSVAPSAASASQTFSPTLGMSQWLPQITAVLSSLGALTQANINDVELIMAHESGGNPNAINLFDSNARAGHPSQGLMQVIPSTFASNAGPYASLGITNPMANIYAGVHYAISRYGSLANVPGVKAVAAGNGYVGYDQGGYLQPGVTQVVNNTGRPEPVFSPEQWASLRAPRGSGGSSVRKFADHVTIVEAGSATATAQETARQWASAGLG